MDNSNQKQPVQPVPQPPMPGQTPVQPNVVNPTPYQMPPKKKLSKGALWGIIGGSIGLIVVIIGIVLAVVFLGGPSQADYKEAYDYMQNSKISSSLSNANKVDDSEEAKKAYNDAIAEVDKYFDELGSKKAMRDSEVKKLYDEYKSEWSKARPILEKYSELATFSREMLSKCRLSSTSKIPYVGVTTTEIGKQFDEIVSSCKEKLSSFEKSDVKEVAEYAKGYKEYINNLRAYYITRAEIFNSRNFSTSMPKLPSLPSNTAILSINKEARSLNITEVEKKLSDLLKEKANR